MISELDSPHLIAGGTHVLNLQALSILFGKALVVGDGFYELSDTSTEFLFQLSRGNGGVLKHIVQDRGGQNLDVTHLPDTCQELGHLNQVVDVRFARAFAHLLSVCMGRERQGSKNFAQVHPARFLPPPYRRGG